MISSAIEVSMLQVSASSEGLYGMEEFASLPARVMWSFPRHSDFWELTSVCLRATFSHVGIVRIGPVSSFLKIRLSFAISWQPRMIPTPV